MDSASRSSNKANRSVRPAKSINQSINQVPHQSTNQSIIPKINSRSRDPPQHIVFPSTSQPIKLSTSQPIKRSTSGSKNQSTIRSIDFPSGTQSTDQSLIVNYHSVDISESPEAHERSSLINRSTNQSTGSPTDQSINQSWTSWFRSLVMDGIYIDKSPHSPYHRSIGQSDRFEDHLLNTSTNQPINRSWKRPLLFGVCSTLLMLCVVIPVTVYFVQSRKPKDFPPFSPVSTCDIFCTGPVLAQIQLAGLFNDSKTFVDLPLVDDPHVVFQAFKALPNHDRDTLRGFLNQWFDSTSVDVLPWNITDWTSRPALIDRLVDPSFQRFAIALNDLWFVLGRRVSPDVYEHPDRHTLLPLKHPYMVVPGGRFREFYYWDSYWIVRGLLLCDMLETAKMIVENLADMVDNFGFVPNGSRQYYLTRSQPPFLAYMVDIVHQKHQNMTWLATMLPSLDKEYDFWMTLDGHAINVTDKHNTSHIVNRYFADVQYPRPESFFEDVMTASELTGDHVGELASNSSSEWPEKAKHLFSELTATAETGWDFSSRWFADRTNISSAETSNIVPVDLNAIMYGFEVILSNLHASLDAQDPLIDEYRNASIARRKAIQALLFDDSEDDHYVWRDYNIKTKGLFGGTNILSNWLPLWTRSFDPDLVDESRVLQQLIDSQLIQAGGLLTTENDIRQQWDCPNAWPPLQHIIMEAVSFTTFDSSDQHVKNSLVDIYRLYDLDSVPSAYSAVGADPGTDQARALSFFLSSQWSKSNFDTFMEQGYMFEKYNAFSRDAGHGGEYDVQAGFGWANGVNLIFLDQYASVLNYTQITDQSWPLPASLPPEQVCKTEPKAPSFVAMSVRSQAEHIQEERHITFQ